MDDFEVLQNEGEEFVNNKSIDNLSYAGYVYKNGAYESNYKTENCIILDFVDPGSCTVMYYLRTPNRDNEFWNFEEILVE